MHHLADAGFDLTLVSSVVRRPSLSHGHARRCTTAGIVAGTVAPLGPRKPEDDPKDAQVFLHKLEIGTVQIFHDPLAAGTNDIQELSRTHEVVSRAKTEMWHPFARQAMRATPRGASLSAAVFS